MSFNEYAFQDVLEILNERPSETLLLGLMITKKNIISLPKKYEPKKEPRYGLDSAASVTQAALLRKAPEAAEAFEKGKVKNKGGAVVPPHISLPAIFASVAEHICNRKGSVEIVLEASSGVRSSFAIDATFFEPYRDDIVGGTRAFFDGLLKKSENARELKIYFDFKPPALN
jgi:hypothetical protein